MKYFSFCDRLKIESFWNRTKHCTEIVTTNYYQTLACIISKHNDSYCEFIFVHCRSNTTSVCMLFSDCKFIEIKSTFILASNQDFANCRRRAAIKKLLPNGIPILPAIDRFVIYTFSNQ